MHVYLKDLNRVIWYMIQPFCETLKQHSINQTLKIISKHNKASFDEALLKYSPYLEEPRLFFPAPFTQNLILILDHLN